VEFALSTEPPTRICPFCAETILAQAKKCHFCNEFLPANEADEPIHRIKQAPIWDPGVAALIILIIPGAGQIYSGRVLAGLAWIFGVVISYLLYTGRSESRPMRLHIKCRA